VRRLAPYFVEDGAGGDATLRALSELQGTPPEPEPAPEPPRTMRCISPISALTSVANTGIKLEGTFTPPTAGALVQVNPGDVLAETNELVARFPDCFEVVED
jgi:hypothetical protein